MNKLLLLALATALISFIAVADESLAPGSSSYIYCELGDPTMCPEPDKPSQFSQKHGYQHPERVKDESEDCTVCHSLYGDDGIMTTRDIGCASVDGFVPPIGFGPYFDTDDRGEEFDTTDTKVGFLPKNTPVKCYSCHEEVKVYINGEKTEFDFEDIRDNGDDNDDSDDTDDGQDPIDPPVEPPTGPVYQCDSKEMYEKHDFTPTPDTNCAACHGNGRTCE